MAVGRKGETKLVRTVTVIGSSVAESHQGVVAIVLDTEVDPIHWTGIGAT